MDLVPWPSSECEAEVDLVSIQTFFALLWKLFLETTSEHKNNLIYIIKHEGLYQNKVTVNLTSTITVKWPIVLLQFEQVSVRGITLTGDGTDRQ